MATNLRSQWHWDGHFVTICGINKTTATVLGALDNKSKITMRKIVLPAWQPEELHFFCLFQTTVQHFINW
jgi:hypothetical protein